MDLLQHKMEKLQRHYMQKESLRVDLMYNLLNTRKMEQKAVWEDKLNLQGASHAMLQQQQLIP